MAAARRWLAAIELAVVTCELLGMVRVSLLPSDAILAQRLAAAPGDASGVGVSVGADESSAVTPNAHSKNQTWPFQPGFDAAIASS